MKNRLLSTTILALVTSPLWAGTITTTTSNTNPSERAWFHHARNTGGVSQH